MFTLNNYSFYSSHNVFNGFWKYIKKNFLLVKLNFLTPTSNSTRPLKPSPTQTPAAFRLNLHPYLSHYEKFEFHLISKKGKNEKIRKNPSNRVLRRLIWGYLIFRISPYLNCGRLTSRLLVDSLFSTLNVIYLRSLI